jgi:plastocyanin
MRDGKSRGRLRPESPHRSETCFALRRRAIATCVTLASLLGSVPAAPADMTVMIIGRNGQGVGEAVVTVTALAGHKIPAPKPAVMDQKNLAFAPRVLAVGVGTSVEFPNNDSVSHQVYSFSPAKRFQLPLYKGQAHPPVIFDHPGLVVLGCNIHDAMVGYIYVTDAPYFGTTDPDGNLEFKNIPDGDYKIALWSPYIVDAPATLIRTVHVDGTAPATTRIQLSLALRALPEPKPRRRDWEY